jgi:hypothetical protein
MTSLSSSRFPMCVQANSEIPGISF